MSGVATLFADHRQKLRRPAEPIIRSAFVDGPYRFALARKWGAGPTILIAGCNPSTADGDRDDPTMWREMSFANRWGFGALIKINVHPFVSPSIAGLRAWRNDCPREPVERNLLACIAAAERAGAFWAAWGAHVAADDLGAWLASLKQRLGRPPAWECLGVNGDGSPRHTLARGRHRIPDDARLVPWRGWG